MKRIILVFSCLLLAGACGGGGPAPTSTSSIGNATTIAKRLKSIDSVQKVITLTEDNDPNDMIGRPNGYVSAAVIVDSTVTYCGKDPGVDCGATIEVWPSAEAAHRRSKYIQGITKEMPILGSEYNYLNGTALLRVSGEVKPSLAAKYEAAFSG